jgi:hypothetical protein
MNNMDELEALVAQVPDEVLDYIDDLEERVEKAEAAIEPEAGDDPIAKALSELPSEVAAVVKAQQARLEEAEKTLEAERVAKADQVWTEKAQGMDRLVDDPAAFGQSLRRVAEFDSALAEDISNTLTAANAQLKKSALYEEIGHGTVSSGSAGEKIANIAKALTEADPSKTMEQAEAEAWEANPDLYEQHVQERRSALKEV